MLGKQGLAHLVRGGGTLDPDEIQDGLLQLCKGTMCRATECHVTECSTRQNGKQEFLFGGLIEVEPDYSLNDCGQLREELHANSRQYKQDGGKVAPTPALQAP